MTDKKSLIEEIIDVINAREPMADEIINACLAIVDSLYRGQGAAEGDVQRVLKDCVQMLNKLLPDENGK